jgi:hypothetical protein
MSLEKLITEDAAANAMAELKQIRDARIQEASQRINAICEELKVSLLPQITIQGNQIGSEIVIVSKI